MKIKVFDMRKFFYTLSVLVCLLGVSGNAWAGGSTTYYSALKATVSSTGGGKVYAGTSNSAGTYVEGTSTSDKQSSTTQNEAKNFYAFAQSNDGYSFTGWSTTKGGDVVSTDNPYKVTVNCSSSTESSPTTTTVFANFVENVAISVNFVPGTNGSYTVNGTKVSTSPSQAITCEGEVSLAATPASGYKFFGWYTSTDGGTTKNYFSYSASTSHTFLAAATVYAEFISSSVATFTVKGTSDYYYDLAKGLTAAASSSSKVLVVATNGTVAAGNYTIPSGVTLLVPYNDGYTVKTTLPAYENNNNNVKTRSLFRQLTLTSGVSLTVSGSMCVGGNLHARNGGQMTATVLDNYGRLQLESGSNVILNGNLYCWGYITGSGAIDARNGSVVYEPFQMDFRGGTHCSNTYKSAFPMCQYYVQNIEAPITFNNGATETLVTCCYASYSLYDGTASFIGSNGMFRLEPGSKLTRHYDGAKDRQCYDLYGNASIQDISVSVSVMKLASKDYVLPINNNMDLTIHSGTTTIYYDLSLLPDSKVIIEEGATVEVKKNLYIYDRSDWRNEETGYGYFGIGADINPVPYSPTKTGSRTSAGLTDAHVVVNGTLKSLSSSGKIYTTTHGADICSTGDGKIVLGVAPTSTSSFKQGISTASSVQDVPVNAAKLQNADGSYLATSGSAANTTINYKNGHWGWVGIWKNGDEVLKTVNVCTENLLVVDSAPALPQPYSDEDYEYICEGWTPVRNGDKQEIVYTPNFRDLPIIKFKMGTNHKSEHKQAYDYDSIPSYNAPNCYGKNNKYIYEFIGWSETADGEILETLLPVTGPKTYYAQYREIPNLEIGNVQTGEEQGEPQSDPEVEERTVNESFTVDTTTIGDNGSLIVTTKNDNHVTLETEVITVQDGGSITIEEGASIKTDEFVLEATLGVIEDTNGDNITVIPNNSSGQVNGGDNIKGRPAEPTAEPTEPKVYFKLAHKGGFKKRTWYAIAVPWTIDVPHHAEGGISIYKNGEYKPQKLSIDFDVLRYDGAMRASMGNVSDCWTYIDDVEGYDKTMKPGVFYMIYLTEDADAIRFEKKADTNFHFGNEVVTTPAPTDETGDANWNGVANPNTYNATVNSPGVLVGQCYVVDSEGQGSYHSITFADEQLSVGVPVFIQTEATSIVVNNPSSTPASAPRRLLEAEQKHDGLVEVQIAPKGLHYSDRVFLQTEEGKKDIYSIGQDVVKAGTSRRMAQMWIDRYDSKLCMNTASAVDNTATYPLGISIPNAGTFTISVPADKLNGDEVYLTKNGRILWDLSAGEYTATFEKGTTTEYGLLLVRNKAPEATQGVDEINAGADGQGAMKVLLNNQVYIIRGGEMYTITGSNVQ